MPKHKKRKITKTFCERKLREKIRKNMKEGRPKKQAIAISFAQTRLDHPECRRFLKR